MRLRIQSEFISQWYIANILKLFIRNFKLVTIPNNTKIEKVDSDKKVKIIESEVDAKLIPKYSEMSY